MNARIVILALACVLAALLPRQLRAQSVESSQRLQRIVSAVHISKLRPSASASDDLSITHLPTVSYRALALANRAGLRQWLRIPLHDRADLTFGGRLGLFGFSSSARLRLRF